MSFVVKQSNSNYWFLFLAIVVVAIVVHMRGPSPFTPGGRTLPQQPPAVSRTEMQRAGLEAAVSGAIGIDRARGDSVSVILVNPDR